MTDGRRVSLTDRWGAERDEDSTLDHFAVLFDEIDPKDDEHGVVGISDDQGWYVEFTPTGVTFGNAEAEADVGSLAPTSRDEALAIAAEFLSGSFDTLRRRPWS